MRNGEPRYLLLSEQYLPLKGGHIVLMHELAKRIGGVTVVTAAAPERPATETIDGVEVRRVDLDRRAYLRPESLALYANLFIQTARLAKRVRPAALLAARVLPEGLIATAVGRLRDLPALIFAHGEEITPWLPGLDRASSRRMTSRIKGRCVWHAYRGAARIIANSRFTRDLLARGGLPKKRIRIVHPGTDPERFRPGLPDGGTAARLGLEDKRVLLTVGRVTWRKGQDTVVRALPTILETVPDTVYAVAGTGPMEDDLRRLARECGVGDHVRLLGEVSDEDLLGLYHLADVFVMAGRVSEGTRDVEGFGIVFLEAGACGVPVIAGQAGGVGDAVVNGQTGLRVDGRDPDAVAEACRRLLTDAGLARRMGEAGRRRAVEEFSWDRVAEQARQVLEEASGDRRCLL